MSPREAWPPQHPAAQESTSRRPQNLCTRLLSRALPRRARPTRLYATIMGCASSSPSVSNSSASSNWQTNRPSTDSAGFLMRSNMVISCYIGGTPKSGSPNSIVSRSTTKISVHALRASFEKMLSSIFRQYSSVTLLLVIWPLGQLRQNCRRRNAPNTTAHPTGRKHARQRPPAQSPEPGPLFCRPRKTLPAKGLTTRQSAF